MCFFKSLRELEMDIVFIFKDLIFKFDRIELLFNDSMNLY